MAMRKLNYMMADFKLRVDHITYDATKKLDALKEELRPVKPIPPSHCIAAPANERQCMLRATGVDFAGQRRSPYINSEILRRQHRELMFNDALYARNSALNQSPASNINDFQGLNINAFNISVRGH